MAATVDILPLMPFRFFDLPPELRCLILEESKEYIRLRRQYNVRQNYRAKVHMLDPALRLVSRQTKDEADYIICNASNTLVSSDVYANNVCLDD
ncbi:hypothetical protein LTR09_011947 [Extremus antarcticus]|uniref:Uncharacterized protein n=1 Tax=Extremus antarcticus TaxID=702011 RepID=A0AAJ0DAV0_9PEZI|nr:hypothetical protein LTR09_011947 [Extremus antarcticus]